MSACRPMRRAVSGIEMRSLAGCSVRICLSPVRADAEVEGMRVHPFSARRDRHLRVRRTAIISPIAILLMRQCHRHSTASSRRLGSQQLLAVSRSFTFALRANSPEVLARPRATLAGTGLPSAAGGGRRSCERRSGVVRMERHKEHAVELAVRYQAETDRQLGVNVELHAAPSGTTRIQPRRWPTLAASLHRPPSPDPSQIFPVTSSPSATSVSPHVWHPGGRSWSPVPP